jgi:DNA mismatch endonuclease (patch repair protein)
VTLGRALWHRGIRYRKNRKDLPGIPDLVFPAARLVVFIDGDFWHGKSWEKRKAKLMKGHNPEYWINKIQQNKARDSKQNRQLRSMGWTVLRIWESEIYSRMTDVIRLVENSLRTSKLSSRRGVFS